MKFRTGFITNSSSSSFIVAFPHIPQSAEDVEKMLFNDPKIKRITKFWQPRGKCPTIKDITRIIFNDIKGQKPNNKMEIASELGHDIYPVDYLDFCDLDGEDLRENYKKYIDFIGKKKAEEFITNNPDAAIYIFEYGNDKKNPELENKEIFSALPCICIGHH